MDGLGWRAVVDESSLDVMTRWHGDTADGRKHMMLGPNGCLQFDHMGGIQYQQPPYSTPRQAGGLSCDQKCVGGNSSRQAQHSR